MALRRARELYGYEAEHLMWADVPRAQVARTTFAHTTELLLEHQVSGVVPASSTARARASPVLGEGHDDDHIAWRAYRCCMCKFVTHAVGSNGSLQLVTNLKGGAQIGSAHV